MKRIIYFPRIKFRPLRANLIFEELLWSGKEIGNQFVKMAGKPGCFAGEGLRCLNILGDYYIL